MKKSLMIIALTLCVAIPAVRADMVNPQLDDVTLNNDYADFVSPVQGNLGGGDGAYGAMLNNLFGGNEFDFLAKDELGGSNDISNTWNGIKFSVASSTFNATSGTWVATWETVGTPGLPATLDLAVVLKAGSGWAAWLFEDEEITVGNSGGEDTWTITFNIGQSEEIKNLSHLSLYGRDYSNPVPEPATMLLFGTGLVGLAGLARRKK